MSTRPHGYISKVPKAQYIGVDIGYREGKGKGENKKDEERLLCLYSWDPIVD